MAVCRPSKYRMDLAMEVVYRQECTWHYEFHAKKNGVLVFGKDDNLYSQNAVHRSIELGSTSGLDKDEYDYIF